MVGVGTTVLNNIYIVNAFQLEGNTGIITCNIKSDTDTVGIATTTETDIGDSLEDLQTLQDPLTQFH